MRLVALSLLLIAAPAAAQSAVTDADTQTVIDDDPLASTRAAGMAGAIVTSADNLDAALHNPAGIGGLAVKGKAPWVRQLYFPSISVSANQNSIKLQSEFKQEGGTGDAAVGKALIDAAGGDRQYVRVSAASGVVLGRMLVLPYYDNQVAAVPMGGGSDMIDLHQRTMSGILFGSSVQDDSQRFTFGYSGYTATRSDVIGNFTYDEINNPDTRKAVTKERTEKYTALGHNGGMVVRLGKKAAPTFGLALKNIGGTKFKAKGDGDDLNLKQDLAAGLALSPAVGKTGGFIVSVQADRLTDSDITLVKKYRLGLELTLGGRGSLANFGLRTGYSDAGVSAGTTLSLGLIGVEAAIESVDVGTGNHKVIERRVTGSFIVNVAEF